MQAGVMDLRWVRMQTGHAEGAYVALAFEQERGALELHVVAALLRLEAWQHGLQHRHDVLELLLPLEQRVLLLRAVLERLLRAPHLAHLHLELHLQLCLHPKPALSNVVRASGAAFVPGLDAAVFGGGSD